MSAKNEDDIVEEGQSTAITLKSGAKQVATFAYAKKVTYTVKYLASDGVTEVAETQTGTGYSGEVVTAEVAAQVAADYYHNDAEPSTQELTLQNDETQNTIVFTYYYSPPQQYYPSSNSNGSNGSNSGSKSSKTSSSSPGWGARDL